MKETIFIFVKSKNGKGIYKVISEENKPIAQETIMEIKKDRSFEDICRDNGIEFYD